ncbi:hypothetical protein GCM10010094_63770 [Streptomyces flaveus]|uniref:Uncharacterized protein n=1 Tax=Streptomyces flaveus TaxID=66370 RepID=A0A917VKH8_9ACTN|nr:hypothetical protein GCM10010094_63770 [Streptomyces flaveus]
MTASTRQRRQPSDETPLAAAPVHAGENGTNINPRNHSDTPVPGNGAGPSAVARRRALPGAVLRMQDQVTQGLLLAMWDVMAFASRKVNLAPKPSGPALEGR